jgi:predicted RNase H-like HicB family nuclease
MKRGGMVRRTDPIAAAGPRGYIHPTTPGIVVVQGKLSKDLPSGTERSIGEAGRAEVREMTGYPVVVAQAADGGYGAWSPDLPGCVALGDTVDECLAEMRAAIALYLEVLRERGEEVPQPRAVETVTIPAA